MVDDVYLKLREHLDSLPGGFPETESGVEMRILEKLFTPEEAGMAVHLRPMPETVAGIAERAGIEEARAAELLESMARQGSIFRVRTPDGPLYMAMQFVIGIYEFHLNTIDLELAEMMEEYLPTLVRSFLESETRQARVVPIGSTLDSMPRVEPYDSIRALVKEQESICVAPCICRKEQGLLGNECERPHENCLTFGFAADYYVENELGRRIDAEEALRILDEAEESALVLQPNNAQQLVNICCCCSCCCGPLRVLRPMERPADLVHSSYRAAIDPELCSMCETCLERCQIDAIVENEDSMAVDVARCIGCGLCVSTCSESAVSMVEREAIHTPPENIAEMMMKIMAEKSSG